MDKFTRLYFNAIFNAVLLGLVLLPLGFGRKYMVG